MRHFYTLGCAMALTACGHAGAGGDMAADTTSAFYHDGHRAAAAMIDRCGDSTAIQNFLLEFQSENYQLELKDGEHAAFDRRRGFEDGVHELDPQLANQIF